MGRFLLLWHHHNTRTGHPVYLVQSKHASMKDACKAAEVTLLHKDWIVTEAKAWNTGNKEMVVATKEG